jgi:hypothetical protein
MRFERGPGAPHDNADNQGSFLMSIMDLPLHRRSPVQGTYTEYTSKT